MRFLKKGRRNRLRHNKQTAGGTACPTTNRRQAEPPAPQQTDGRRNRLPHNKEKKSEEKAGSVSSFGWEGPSMPKYDGLSLMRVLDLMLPLV
jgi:hypothetical protein